MKIKIRVYNPYDLDIIALVHARKFSVSNAMAETLKYYAAGKRYLVEIPVLPEDFDKHDYVRGFYVELDDDKDKQAVNFIKTVPEGYRNAFMKNIFRASFEVSPMSLYLGHGSMDYIREMIDNPRMGKYPVQREVYDSVSLSEHEIGVSFSDEITDVSELPQGEKVIRPKENPVAEFGMREMTQAAYKKAEQVNENQQSQAKAVVDAIETRKRTAEDELDNMMDSIM